MRWLEPGSAAELVAAYGDGRRRRARARPWVVMNMVASIDGATAIEGRSGALGGEGDARVFRVVRDLADVVVVGAATVRAEGYRCPPSDRDTLARRRASGSPGPLVIAVVTASMNLDVARDLFDESNPTLVITTAESRRSSPDIEGADIVAAGEDQVDMGTALDLLAERGHQVVLCEGGSRLNDQMLAADLIDEVCLTISPQLVSGPSSRVAHGHIDQPRAFELVHVLRHDDELHLRYVRRR